MRFHHMCLVVSDLEKATRLWRDVLGFEVQVDVEVPNGPAISEDGIQGGPETQATPRVVDDAFGVKDARCHVVLLANSEGAMIELMQTLNPNVQRTPKEMLRYGYTGFTELGLAVDDIQYWFDRVREAGYKTQTEYIWPSSSAGHSFLFYDDDGNLIQFWQQNPETAAWT
jgi:catechol 2,3-dioxygenase-like lactoylglutathione lyase family enzyme